MSFTGGGLAADGTAQAWPLSRGRSSAASRAAAPARSAKTRGTMGDRHRWSSEVLPPSASVDSGPGDATMTACTLTIRDQRFSMLKKYAVLSALAVAVSTPAMAQGLSDFRLQALQANAFEIQSSQIALSKSRNPQIRTYAQEAIRDHRSANVALVGGDRNYVAAQGGVVGGPVDGLIGAPLAVAGGA
ncbi:DUF4142 domain-containing protein, partial [Methylobacterium sp. WL103]|uniref:DUF4142 domain-containing protein n=1 Tax=Methylobacterium sp. WL103 TaxID=2603891 RepID=UPI001FEE7668